MQFLELQVREVHQKHGIIYKVAYTLANIMFANQFIANHLPSVFLTNTKNVCGSVGTVFVWIFVLFHVRGKISYLAVNFHITTGAVGSSFSPGSPEVHGKINFPNMFASAYAALDIDANVSFRISCDLRPYNIID